MNFKGAIFDLDGTLLDSMRVWKEIDCEFMGKRGLPLEDDYVRAISPLGFPKAAEYTKKRYGLKETAGEIMAEWHAMCVEKYRYEVGLKPFVREYLQKLSDLKVKMSIATASHEELYMPALKRCGIDAYFSSVTTVGEVENGKGFPDIYLKAAEKMGLQPFECAVFEDIFPGISGASSGGFYTVAVYEEASAFDWENIKKICGKYILSFKELLSVNL